MSCSSYVTSSRYRSPEVLRRVEREDREDTERLLVDKVLEERLLEPCREDRYVEVSK